VGLLFTTATVCDWASPPGQEWQRRTVSNLGAYHTSSVPYRTIIKELSFCSHTPYSTIPLSATACFASSLRSSVGRRHSLILAASGVAHLKPINNFAASTWVDIPTHTFRGSDTKYKPVLTMGHRSMTSLAVMTSHFLQGWLPWQRDIRSRGQTHTANSHGSRPNHCRDHSTTPLGRFAVLVCGRPSLRLPDPPVVFFGACVLGITPRRHSGVSFDRCLRWRLGSACLSLSLLRCARFTRTTPGCYSPWLLAGLVQRYSCTLYSSLLLLF
jgi:hypothetical protein